MRKNFLEQLLFVFGSVLTCALVLWIAKVQAATTPVVVRAVIPIEQASRDLADVQIEICSDPLLAKDTSSEIALILESQHAKPIDENSLRTNDPKEDLEIATSGNPSEVPEQIEESMDHLCASKELGEDKAFALAANRLLCEAVGANDDLHQFDRSTFVASKN